MNTKATEINGRTYEIIDGPNKDLLFDACKYAYSEAGKISVDFTITSGHTMSRNDPRCAYLMSEITDIRITSIQHEDGSGESFNLKGHCRARLGSHKCGIVDYKTYSFKAYYSSKRRKGSISFLES